MDNKRLTKEEVFDKLKKFQDKSEGKVLEYRLEPLFKGYPSSPFILKVYAPYTEPMGSFEALDAILEILQPSVEPEVMHRIDGIFVEDSREGYEKPFVYPALRPSPL